MIYKIYESGNYLIIDTYDEVALVVTASAQYAKKNSYYNKTVDGYVITEFGGGEFAITSADIAANLWTDNAAVPLSESEIVDILQNHTGNFKSAGGSSSAFVGATLMKSGQQTSYRTGDDGGLQAGRAVDFFTLENAGPFGTNRFTDELGGQTYSNNIVIDWSTYDNVAGTVLGYYRRLVSSGGVFNFNWNDAIDLALSHSVGTFTSGWRLPNIKEMYNIGNFNSNTMYNYSPFDNGSGGQIVGQNLWTSTTLAISTTNALYIPSSQYGYAQFTAKTNAGIRLIAVRTFTVIGTTLL
jgi:hypothetical protein